MDQLNRSMGWKIDVTAVMESFLIDLWRSSLSYALSLQSDLILQVSSVLGLHPW